MGDKFLTTKWKHPGGKLREEGADSLTDRELLAVLISTGIKGKPAEQIADEILQKFGSLEGLANQPLEKLLEIKGLSDVKIIRIAAAFELARRLMERGKRPDGEEKQTHREGNAHAGDTSADVG